MNLKELLLGKAECECGRSHSCPIKYVYIGKGAISSVAIGASEYKNILLVADENTYRVAGDATVLALGDKIKNKVIFPSELLVPNEAAIAKINAAITPETDLIVGVGSGVINDLCKHTSFINGIKYHIVATAPSMDGYASKGAALILGGMKVTLNAEVPEAIIADTDVLKNAPMDMILAGYGDIIGKYSCLSDWKLANLVNGEYLCPFVLQATYDEVEKTRRLADGLLSSDSEAVGALIEALVAVGILMAYVGNSRPASGSEHHFSHYFEIVGIVRGEKYLPHGIDVFYSAAETAKIREELVAIENIDDVTSKFDREVYENNIRRIYGSVADEVIELQDKLGWYNEIEKRLTVYKAKWQEIRALLKTAPTFDEMNALLSQVKMSYSDFVEYYGEEKIRDAYAYAKDLKDRYSVLWLYSDINNF